MLKGKRMITWIMVMVMILSLSACNQKSEEAKESMNTKGYPLTITDSNGREVTIEKEPMRIVSVAPNITEIVFALGAGDKLVGRTDYCDYPKDVKKVDSIGSLQEPNIEKILDLKPDLVIASAHFKEDVLKKLEELNIPVIVLYGPDKFEGVYDVIEKMGLVLNKQESAQKIVSDMKNRVSNVLDKVKDQKTPSVYYVIGFGETGDFTAGKGTFIGEIITMAGGKNAADDVEGWKYSLEKLVEKDPNILICSNEYSPKEKVVTANGYKDLTAVKEGRIYDVDTDLLELYGPRLVDGLERLAEIIHPELFK